VQGTLPAIEFDGKLLLARKYRLAVSPDGHGGCLTALRKNGALDDMASRGVEQISYFQVDNPIVRCLDPLFLGLHDLAGAEMSAKALPKNNPLEKLGNFCVVDGKVLVIEYSDLPEDLARSCLPDGRLKFSAGSIAIHLFRRDFVQRLTDGGRCLLPFHRADKKVPYVDPATGEMVSPTEPNAVKLEMFVFDALPLAEKTMLLETRREEEFSPIKNMEGVDSLATSLHDQVRRWATWLEAAGVNVPRDADGHIAAAIEISPLYADSAEELAKKVDKTITISPGQNFYLGSKGQIGGS
jgi:UDP-N-acetylglucosamine/UDP-N-acetylgalactosamine diphosphorylase